jgi:hypothetical protein
VGALFETKKYLVPEVVRTTALSAGLFEVGDVVMDSLSLYALEPLGKDFV